MESHAKNAYNIAESSFYFFSLPFLPLFSFYSVHKRVELTLRSTRFFVINSTTTGGFNGALCFSIYTLDDMYGKDLALKNGKFLKKMSSLSR